MRIKLQATLRFPTSDGRHQYNGPAVYIEYDVATLDDSFKEVWLNLLRVKDPVHRGLNLGSLMMKEFIRGMFSDPDLGVIRLTATPLKDEKPSTHEQLKKFYAELGFLGGAVGSFYMTKSRAVELKYCLEEALV